MLKLIKFSRCSEHRVDIAVKRIRALLATDFLRVQRYRTSPDRVSLLMFSSAAVFCFLSAVASVNPEACVCEHACTWRPSI